MLKKDLRLHYIALRKDVSPPALLNSSLTIANKLLALPIWSLNYYHIFLPITSQNEIDTSFILSILQGKDKNIVLPKIEGSNNLKHILLTDNTRLKANSRRDEQHQGNYPASGKNTSRTERQHKQWSTAPVGNMLAC